MQSEPACLKELRSFRKGSAQSYPVSKRILLGLKSSSSILNSSTQAFCCASQARFEGFPEPDGESLYRFDQISDDDHGASSPSISAIRRDPTVDRMVRQNADFFVLYSLPLPQLSTTQLIGHPGNPLTLVTAARTAEANSVRRWRFFASAGSMQRPRSKQPFNARPTTISSPLYAQPLIARNPAAVPLNSATHGRILRSKISSCRF